MLGEVEYFALPKEARYMEHSEDGFYKIGSVFAIGFIMLFIYIGFEIRVCITTKILLLIAICQLIGYLIVETR